MSPTRLEGQKYTEVFNAAYDLFRLPPEQRPPIPHFQQSGPIFTDHATSCSYGINAKKGEVDRVSTDLRKSTQWGLLEDALTTSDGETELCLFNDQVGGLPSRAIVAVREHDSGKYNVTQTLKATANQCFRDDRTQVCFNSKSGNYETSTVFAQSTQLKVQEQVVTTAPPARSAAIATGVQVATATPQYSKASQENTNQFIQENRISTAPATPDPADFMADFAKVSFPLAGIALASVFVASIIANRKRLKRLAQNAIKPITTTAARIFRTFTAGGIEVEVIPPQFVQVKRYNNGKIEYVKT
jgi:hypothetical protein